MKKIMIVVSLTGFAALSACSETDKRVDSAEDIQEMASADTAVMYGDLPGVTQADGAEIIRVEESFWDNVDYNAPTMRDEKVKDEDVEVRGTTGYTIYSMDEKILFDVDKATLRAGSENRLRSIAESINSLSTRGPIRIYGHTDSTASAAYNKQLAEERANAVKNWLQSNTAIDGSRMSVVAVGQARPVASNETPEGRQRNRRVVIVAATSTAPVE
ncbi:OmpA family protein [Pontibacter sp. JH31]|uniref:OmpA family protein n=1 Tax=Pontibacter aquaedesilientis TaxID=2766980 RepID=A0ABR7XGG2_9BACT|nr:OmpA family protein [Pontibacter aquaedesilientis]MBD1397352.1 OmpA family protein [Pontibacter aquaedesilientis]